MNLALAFDELLTDPALSAAAQHAYDSMPVAVRDQFEAASAHAHVVTGVLGNTIGSDPDKRGLVPAASFPEWVRLGALAALAGFLSGESATCMHSPQPDRAQPIVAAAWKPGMIACPSCILILNCPRGSVADRTCDGCGYITTGPEFDDGIHPAVTQIGCLVYQYGVCRACLSTLPEPIA